MPTYMYKAVTKTGLIVRNRVESPSRQTLIKSLKNNDLMPHRYRTTKIFRKKEKSKKEKHL